MANNQKKLKAFVRYDGSGRVVASSLILRKNKPRVGRWYEIPEYLCCNGGSTTTTTTTTAPTTTTTTTTAEPVYKAFTVNSIYAAAGSICGTPNVFELTRYFTGAGNYPVVGDTIYFLSAGQYFPLFTGPGSYTKMSNNLAITSNEQGLVLDVFSCPPSIDFVIASVCDSNVGPNSPYIKTSNYSGSSTGLVYPGIGAHATEQEALDAPFATLSPKGPADDFYYGTTGGYTVGQTYWVAVQDTGNPANKVAKSVTIVSCS